MIRDIQVENLRGIRIGFMTDLAPLSVLVGPNGSGKSTLLEGLLIGANPNVGFAIGRSVRRHPGVTRGAQWLLHKGGQIGATVIVVQTSGGKKRWVGISRDSEPMGADQIIRFQTEQSGMPRTEAEVRFDHLNNYEVAAPVVRPLPDVPEVRIVEPSLADLQAPLEELYSDAVKLGRRRQVKEMIASLVEGVEAIELLAETGAPVTHLVYESHSIPVALSGEGVHSFVRLALELAARRRGTVLAEEPEVHQHPGAIRQSARAIWAAVRRDVQVVVTTHSLELIDALVAEGAGNGMDKFAVYSVRLIDGELKYVRKSGSEVAFARTTIEADLR